MMEPAAAGTELEVLRSDKKNENNLNYVTSNKKYILPFLILQHPRMMNAFLTPGFFIYIKDK